MKRVLWMSDVHLEDEVPKAYNVITRKLLPKEKFDEIILGGDFMDCASMSFHDKDKPLILENKRYQREIDFTNSELDYLQKHTKKITYLEGNHEERVLRAIERDPVKLDGRQIPIELHLKKRGIKWYPMNVPYQICKDLIGVHGAWCSKYHASKHLQEYGCRNIIYGHTHKPQTFSMNFGKPVEAFGIGCVQDPKDVGYLKNKPSGWLQQFAIIEIEKYFQVNTINIINNSFIWGGKVWK